MHRIVSKENLSMIFREYFITLYSGHAKLVQRVYVVKRPLSQNNCSIINIREGKAGRREEGKIYTAEVCARVFDTRLIAVT